MPGPVQPFKGAPGLNCTCQLSVPRGMKVFMGGRFFAAHSAAQRERAFSICDPFVAFSCGLAAQDGVMDRTMTSSFRIDGLARAAMLGLLASQSVACEGSADSGATTSDSSTASDSTSDSTTSDMTTSDSATSDSGSSEGGSTAAMGILSSKVIPNLTLEQFSEECQEAGGVVETHGHCGGANTCKGFSYDTDTEVYTVHTCRGYNTCTGFSCVVPDEG